MDTPPKVAFESLNEIGLREEVLFPFLKSLGYRSGTENDISRGTKLRYPRLFIGRKKPSRDPILTGEADYVMSVQAGATVLRWVIEAKAPSEEIDSETVEQAYSYAKHPEVGATCFAVTNGRELAVYDALAAPHESKPFYKGSWPTWFSDAHLRDILTPASIRTRYRHIPALFLEPLGAGLSGREEIRSGEINYHTAPHPAEHLSLISIPIVEGHLDRAGNGRLRGRIVVGGHDREMAAQMRAWGQTDTLLASNDTRLSDDPSQPTVFTGGREIRFPKGGKLRDLVAGVPYFELPRDIVSTTRLTASGHLEDGVFVGDIELLLFQEHNTDPLMSKGTFRILLR